MFNQEYAIEVRELSLNFKDRTILDSISFEVSEGKVLGILGRSGSGKTSLFRSMLGVPTLKNIHEKGAIRFYGKKRDEIPTHLLQPVFQDPVSIFNPSWSLEKALKEPFRIIGGDVAQRGERSFQELLHSFQLNGKNLNRNVLTFSGGELQRAAILRALLAEPKILFLDEALGALDPILLNEILHFLRQISQDRKITILLITHSLRMAEKFCDEIGILEQGKLVDLGKPGEILSKPKSDFTRELIRANDLSSLRVLD
ncbi:ATP-binding cassette domain-containing protein [Leptospira gomenensis]|uniref:ATP-binding cassette domain-containing protein n=1 Tax=Leptospira gomenensis TaxID=2484974 RepID=A0A5F1YBA9_9LEPT|nr:ATP-binding cassette domain-containing protein [Leptospira gomenensis]TGK34600.1 ATP-binding cassette domain-containing protein [Leptospira gomenensis]TGK40090.1 ATP-binding cassette domain-containing protein [Leptospira gomenensis]TGK40500.1 ATP-binding cassette domain-containing protein [Leptospira gomenensis]TGK55599.1 ATP-binding cassette domain-containing protein [Leptospira gomenensis]